MTVQLPIKLPKAKKRELRSQFAALVYRVKDDKLQILLITSRGTGRWIIPKGWPMLGLRPAEAAAQEAWEEAGVKGEVTDQCIGLYSYYKTDTKDGTLPCLVNIYPVNARKLSKIYPEAGQRRRKWFSPKKAAKLVREPELAKLIKSFDPEKLF
ncbi:MAG: NUDIX hydrolase [Cognatishimia sp.]|uniref:NUDIX hydrolase n=1 Tax=Cognatishimia sp. TaxID=2211648 RepID=UPI003B8E9784